MNKNLLIKGAKLQPLGTTKVREIEDVIPGTATTITQYKVNGNVFGYAGLMARYRLLRPGGRPDMKGKKLRKKKPLL